MVSLTGCGVTDMLVVLAAVTGVVYLYFASVFTYWKRRGVPFPRPLPVVGNFLLPLLQKRSPGQFLWDIYNSAPDARYVGFYIFNKPILMLRDPDLIKQMLVKDFNLFSDRYIMTSSQSDPVGAHNLFMLRGALWRYLRIKMSPTFTSGRMKKMYPMVQNCAKQLADYVVDHSGDNTPIEVKETTAKYATDVISTCAFGIDSNSLKDPKAEFREFGRMIFHFTRYRTLEVMAMFFVPWLTKLLGGTVFTNETADFLRKVFWDAVRFRESNNVNRDDFLNLLLQLKNKGSIDLEEVDKLDSVTNGKEKDDIMAADKEQQVFEFAGDNLVAQAALFFTAGFETNATTMSFTLYELSLHPELQNRLRQEIAAVMKRSNGAPTYEDIFGMKYLHMVVSETLRKYPPLPLLDRVCQQNYKFPGTDLTIEKGTPVFLSLLGLQRDPKHYPNPDDYNPERFSEENKRSVNPYTNLPFGEGPHNCIGMRFGYMTVKTGLVQLLSEFEVKPCRDTPIPLKICSRASVLASVGGIPLSFIRSKAKAA